MSERLFVAVVPPPAVVAAWDEFLDPRRDAEPDFRWTVPDGWHLTCAFMAGVPSGLVDPLVEALDEVAARTAPFGVEVGGAGAFPDPDRAKALWLGVRAGASDLAQLATRVRNACAGTGAVVDGGRFRGHLTIARTRPMPARRWLTILDAMPPASWSVEEFVLIRSLLLRGGSGYQAVSRHRLVGGG
ncbi:MAG: RNA 2',3'-cyclic phosphodiesterase [Actinobacteria bacterium]|nr:RNA 2',3'-cyclic phosphodiesterase [Actinomycetota bacterium]